MATINDPNTAGNIMRVGMGGTPGWMPAHVAGGPLPVGAGGAYRLGAISGTIAASLGANSELFQFRYVTSQSRVCIVHGIAVSAACIVAPAVGTTPVNFALRATRARAWTAAGSGGTRLTLSGNSAKMRTSQATSEVNDAGIATTGALTAGTKTLDPHDIGAALRGVYFDLAAADADLTLMPKTNLLGEFVGGLAWPLVLDNQDGFVIRTAAALPATMTWNLEVDVAWSEVDGF